MDYSKYTTEQLIEVAETQAREITRLKNNAQLAEIALIGCSTVCLMMSVLACIYL